MIHILQVFFSFKTWFRKNLCLYKYLAVYLRIPETAGGEMLTDVLFIMHQTVP